MNRRGPQFRQIGLFGGTFDPLHVGHLIIAESARVQLGLERVYFVPVARAPHKKGRKAAPAYHRLAMLRLALRDHPEFVASDAEIRRGGISYTVDTLRQLAAEHPAAGIWLIVGSDNLRDLYRWKEPLEILNRCRIAVYRRPGYPLSKTIVRRTKPVVLDGGLLDISATVIRRIEAGSGSIRFLVPSVVERYIRRHRLYRSPTRRP
jgi:nicotinate-nucleotide adenylyltransferase